MKSSGNQDILNCKCMIYFLEKKITAKNAVKNKIDEKYQETGKAFRLDACS